MSLRRNVEYRQQHDFHSIYYLVFQRGYLSVMERRRAIIAREGREKRGRLLSDGNHQVFGSAPRQYYFVIKKIVPVHRVRTLLVLLLLHQVQFP